MIELPLILKILILCGVAFIGCIIVSLIVFLFVAIEEKFSKKKEDPVSRVRRLKEQVDKEMDIENLKKKYMGYACICKYCGDRHIVFDKTEEMRRELRKTPVHPRRDI